MVLCMKTTLEIRDELFIEAKKLAVELHRPLRSLVEEGLRDQLQKAGKSLGSGKQKIKWVTGHGGLPPGLDIDNRKAMHEWIARSK